MKGWRKFRKSSAPDYVQQPDGEKLQRTLSCVDFFVEFDARAKTSVRLKTKDVLDVKENEKFLVLGIKRDFFHVKSYESGDTGWIPSVSLDINLHCCNVYLRVLQPLLRDVKLFEEVVMAFPGKMCNLIRSDRDITGPFRVLFESELRTNRRRGLDTDSFRTDTPAVVLFKALLKHTDLSGFRFTEKFSTPVEVVKKLLSVVFPLEVTLVLKCLLSVVNSNNCSIDSADLVISVFCLRVLVPLMINTPNFEHAKQLMKSPRLLLPIVEKIESSRLELPLPPNQCFLEEGLFIYQHLIQKSETFRLDEQSAQIKQVLGFYSAGSIAF